MTTYAYSVLPRQAALRASLEAHTYLACYTTAYPCHAHHILTTSSPQAELDAARRAQAAAASDAHEALRRQEAQVLLSPPHLPCISLASP